MFDNSLHWYIMNPSRQQTHTTNKAVQYDKLQAQQHDKRCNRLHCIGYLRGFNRITSSRHCSNSDRLNKPNAPKGANLRGNNYVHIRNQ